VPLALSVNEDAYVKKGTIADLIDITNVSTISAPFIVRILHILSNVFPREKGLES